MGGSDAHRTGQIGTAATEFFGRVECLDDLLRLLRSGEYRPVDLRSAPQQADYPASAGAGRRTL